METCCQGILTAHRALKPSRDIEGSHAGRQSTSRRCECILVLGKQADGPLVIIPDSLNICVPPLQDEQRELAKTIRVSGSILLSTVSNFLDFFKMEAGKALDIVRTEVDVQVRTRCLF